MSKADSTANYLWEQIKYHGMTKSELADELKKFAANNMKETPGGSFTPPSWGVGTELHRNSPRNYPIHFDEPTIVAGRQGYRQCRSCEDGMHGNCIGDGCHCRCY